MHSSIGRVLALGQGVATRANILTVVSHDLLDRAVRRGELARLLPRVYTWPGREGARVIRARGALAYAGPEAVLSHLTAADWWRMTLPEHSRDRVHVLLPRAETHRSSGYAVVHRTESDLEASTVVSGGVPMLDAVPALVGAWALLAPSARRALVIDAVRQGIVAAQDLLTATEPWSILRGRRDFRQLAADLLVGAHSELEIFGLRRVFDHPDLPRATHQHPVHVGGRVYRLDLAYENLKIGIELDGAAYHGSRAQRERDLRRDSALAAAGWLIVRISYQRLTTEPDEVRRELLMIIATRRAQLSA